MQMPRLIVMTVILAVLGTMPSMARAQVDKGEARIAEEAFIYGFPMVMNYAVFYQYFVDKSDPSYKAPLNQIYNAANVFTYKDTAIVTPNSDTPYSFIGMDLRAEPYVICNPEIEKSRYFSVQLVDMYTFNYGYIGSRATGNGAACFMIAGPNWKGRKPEGIAKVFRCETDFSFAGFRTQLFNAADIDNVRKIQADYRGLDALAIPEQTGPTSRSRDRMAENRQETGRRRSLRLPQLRLAVLSSDWTRGSGGSDAGAIREDRSRGGQAVQSRQAHAARKDRARIGHEEWP